MNYGTPGEDDPDGDELRHCAAGVLHNASNVSRVAHLIVQAPGMLETLQVRFCALSSLSSIPVLLSLLTALESRPQSWALCFPPVSVLDFVRKRGQDLTTGRACLVWGRGDRAPEFSKASIDAVCIINNLAKHQVSRRALVDAGFLEGLIKLVSFGEYTHFSVSDLEKGEVSPLVLLLLLLLPSLAPPTYTSPARISAEAHVLHSFIDTISALSRAG